MGSGQFGTPGLVTRDIAGLHWERELASAQTDVTWDLYTDYARAKTEGIEEAHAIDAVLSASGRSYLTQMRSPSTRTAPNADSPLSSPTTRERFLALEARCQALEQDLRGRDAELRDLQEMATRRQKEYERKEREVEELNLRNSALQQRLSEKIDEVGVVTQRATELELEVQRREDRECQRLRSDFPRDNVDLPSDLNDFSRQVRQVNNARRVGDIPIIEANLISNDFPPTLAALRNLYDHKKAHAERMNSMAGGDARSTPRTERPGSATAPNSQNLRSERSEHSNTRKPRKSDGAWR
jgi:chromosome segregation ATPase